ncbi:MAG: hypothetical protein EBQ99_01625 [Planctomycetes bacterium]|nr:hypothetical protein [Planctomycetota bacterium]
MTQAPAFHVMDRRLPQGVPLLASWWWRAVVAGVTVGLVPLLVVLWAFIDMPAHRLLDWMWPGWLVGARALGSPVAWLAGGGAIFLVSAALRRRDVGRWGFLLAANVASGLALAWVCGAGIGLLASLDARSGSPAWLHLWPDARCAAAAAAAMTLWIRVPSMGRVLLAMVALVVLGESAVRTAFLSDALAGAWCGTLGAMAVPWAWWSLRNESYPAITPAAAPAP